MLKPEAGYKEIQNLVFNSAKPRRKQNKQFKNNLLLRLQKSYNTLFPCLIQFSVAKSPLFRAVLINYIHRIFWNIFYSSSWSKYKRQCCPYINIFWCRNSLPTKSTSSSFFLRLTNHGFGQLKILALLLLVSWYKLLLEVSSVQGRGNINKEWEILCAKNKCEASATYQAH